VAYKDDWIFLGFFLIYTLKQFTNMKDKKHIRRFNESDENLNTSDFSSSKIIYTVLPYYSNSQEVNQSGVKSFMDFKKAEEYTWTLDYQFDVVENELI
jgi:hypothetical protein